MEGGSTSLNFGLSTETKEANEDIRKSFLMARELTRGRGENGGTTYGSGKERTYR